MTIWYILGILEHLNAI